MKIILRNLIAITTAALLTAACAGTPVAIGTRVSGPSPTGTSRTIIAKACGFQLLLLIPIGINSRAERAYQQLEVQAGGDFITDVQVQESWGYGFVGTSYCTTLKAKAVRPAAPAVLPVPPASSTPMNESVPPTLPTRVDEAAPVEITPK